MLLPLEAAAVAALVVFAIWRRGRRVATSAELDVPERISDALVSLRLSAGAAAAIATEAAVLFYAVAAWKRKPFVPSGARALLLSSAKRARRDLAVGVRARRAAAADFVDS